jgi:hypothetical protein
MDAQTNPSYMENDPEIFSRFHKLPLNQFFSCKITVF